MGDAKIIVITGATRGLGRAMAAGFMARGHTVLGCGRSVKDCAALAMTAGLPHDFSAVDVADGTAVARWADRLLQTHDPPDLLINNAALMNRPAPLWEIPAQEFDALVEVNLKGVAHVIRAFVPAMVRRSRGVIINFSSGWGRSAAPEVAPYCASKFAVEGLTLALAQELPSGMAAIPLDPGVINTDMLRRCWPGQTDGHPDPETWAQRAVPFILGLGPQHSGKSLTVR